MVRSVAYAVCMKVELSEERANSDRYKKQSQILRLELDHLLQQLNAYVTDCIAQSRALSVNFSLRDVIRATSMSCRRWIRATSVSAEIGQLFHNSFRAVKPKVSSKNPPTKK